MSEAFISDLFSSGVCPTRRGRKRKISYRRTSSFPADLYPRNMGTPSQPFRRKRILLIRGMMFRGDMLHLLDICTSMAAVDYSFSLSGARATLQITRGLFERPRRSNSTDRGFDRDYTKLNNKQAWVIKWAECVVKYMRLSASV